MMFPMARKRAFWRQYFVYPRSGSVIWNLTHKLVGGFILLSFACGTVVGRQPHGG